MAVSASCSAPAGASLEAALPTGTRLCGVVGALLYPGGSVFGGAGIRVVGCTVVGCAVASPSGVGCTFFGLCGVVGCTVVGGAVGAGTLPGGTACARLITSPRRQQAEG